MTQEAQETEMTLSPGLPETNAFPRPGILPGSKVTLEPFEERHRDALRAGAEEDQSIWKYFPLTFNGEGEHFDTWFDYTLQRSAQNEHYPFVVRRSGDGRIIGTTRFYDMSAIHRRLAIGSTWYIPEARGTAINAEVRLICLTHAFEILGVNRVELITDPRNLASRAAMKLLGAVQEGVIRQDLIYRDGRVRDSVLYSIVRDEWPAVRQRLVAKVGTLDRQAQASSSGPIST